MFKAELLVGVVHKWNQFKLIHIKSYGFEETGKPEYPEKNFPEKSTNKLNPHMTRDLGIEPGPHRYEASALTTTASMLPQFSRLFL